jgi:hypothetical protein
MGVPVLSETARLYSDILKNLGKPQSLHKNSFSSLFPAANLTNQQTKYLI